MQRYTLPIKGMHCRACTIVIPQELENLPGVKNASADLKTNTITFEAETAPPRKEIEYTLKSIGYSLGEDQQSLISRDKSVYEQFAINLVAVTVIFLLLGGIGVTDLRLGNISNSNIILALIIGVTAGFSTCMALVGGLVLGLSSRFAEKHPTSTSFQRFRPHLFFNLGRIVSFFILGGVIGVIGSVFRLNSTSLGLLTIAIGFVMVFIGLQLTDLFPRLSKKGLSLPVSVTRLIGIKNHGSKEYSHKNALVLGALLFFLPCGFTQSMQLVAISSGSFVTGSLVMGMFAIGTTPGLLGVGGLTSVVKGSFAKSFFRFAGVVVIALALYNISNGVTQAGFKLNINNAGYSVPETNNNSSSNSAQSYYSGGPVNVNGESSDAGSTGLSTSGQAAQNATVISATVNNSGMNPTKFTAKAGQSYVLEVNPTENVVGCMSTIMIPGVYKKPELLEKDKKISMPFTINKPGNYPITCAMGITFGTITVTN